VRAFDRNDIDEPEYLDRISVFREFMVASYPEMHDAITTYLYSPFIEDIIYEKTVEYKTYGTATQATKYEVDLISFLKDAEAAIF